MRRNQFEIKDPAIIVEILSGSEVCRIAMIDNGRPYIVPLNYGYRNNAIYFHSSPLGKKIEILKAKNRVCFEIELSSQIIMGDRPCDWGTKYRSVTGYGTIEFITDFNGKKEGLDIIMSHYGKTGNNEYSEKEVNNVLILKLQIEEITGKQKGDWE
jgi:nitroimidazol reductase NimA-like FMN-containing flavoprotein (pyridoxamine 5'-phosphate oxidase superfamily)